MEKANSINKRTVFKKFNCKTNKNITKCKIKNK